jgi:hypothetical protein
VATRATSDRVTRDGNVEMPLEFDTSKLLEHLAAAGGKGRTKTNLESKIPSPHRSKFASILNELRSAGSIKGPFKNRSDFFFAPQFAPTRARAEELIETILRDAGAKLTTKSALEKTITGFLKVFFKDALAALKSEARIVELKGGRSAYYVHRDVVLEQLRLTDDRGAGTSQATPIRSPRHAEITLDDVRPIYERLKTEQGGIGTVKIYDVMTRLGAAKEELHRLLINESKSGRLSLHRASTAKFPAEVIEAGIRLEGEPEPLVTVVLKD